MNPESRGAGQRATPTENQTIATRGAAEDAEANDSAAKAAGAKGAAGKSVSAKGAAAKTAAPKTAAAKSTAGSSPGVKVAAAKARVSKAGAPTAGSSPVDAAGSAGVIGEQDIHFFREGTHAGLYRILGCRFTADGARFTVWAPDATSNDQKKQVAGLLS